MSTRVSIKQKLLNQLEDADSILRDISAVTSKKGTHVNIIPLIELLLEKDQQLKETFKEIEAYNEIQKKIDRLRADCALSDKQINNCQIQLKKAEVVLSTALYYTRQKLDSMTTAVKNPVDMEELVRFSHRISATHGAIAPDNWMQGDPRRPYPNKEEIRRGYLGHLDDAGNFRPSLWDALSETTAAGATMVSGTSSSTNTPIPTGGSTQTLSHHPSQSHTLPAVTSIPCSPNMMLPGVNMVSSPVTIPQSSPSTAWSSTGGGNSNPSELCPSSRPPTSLAAMLAGTSILDHHPRFGSNMTLPPPPLRPTSGQSTGPSSVRSSLSSSRGSFSNIRQTVPLSPSSLVGPVQSQHFYADTMPNVGQNPRSTQSHTRRGRPKQIHAEDIELLSSNSSSETSSGEE